jgi:hypothetical protein
LESIALRHQIAVLERSRSRPRFHRIDRLLDPADRLDLTPLSIQWTSFDGLLTAD